MYSIKFLGKALEDLKRIAKPHQKIIKEKLLILVQNPEALKNNIKKLSTEKEVIYRLLVGSYRVIFQKDQHKLIILIIRIGHRKDVYSKLLDKCL